jgi:predicted XRE-type DNA-binding protein
MLRETILPIQAMSVRMAASLNAILAARKLTQAEAARVLGVNQPKVSALKGYKLEGFRWSG